MSQEMGMGFLVIFIFVLVIIWPYTGSGCKADLKGLVLSLL